MKFNREYFESQIKSSGLKKSFIADKMGIDRNSLTNKIKGKTEFTHNEACILFSLLGADSLDKQTKFFCP